MYGVLSLFYVGFMQQLGFSWYRLHPSMPA